MSLLPSKYNEQVNDAMRDERVQSDYDGATTWGMKCIVLHLNPSQYLSSLLISTDDEDMIVMKC